MSCRTGRLAVTAVTNGAQFIGEYRPVQTMYNGAAVAGWRKSVKSGESLCFESTYNDRFHRLTLMGKSEQARTVQGKNLLDKDRFVEYKQQEAGFVRITETGVVYTRKNSSVYGGVKAPLKLAAGQTYHIDFSRQGGSSNFFLLDDQDNMVGALMFGPQAVTPAADTAFIGFSNNLAAAPENEISNLIVTKGSDVVAYEPFTPDSPSPDYPSPIRSVGGNLVAAGRGGSGRQLIMPALRSIGDTRDEWDVLTGAVMRQVGVKVFDGTENMLSTSLSVPNYFTIAIRVLDMSETIGEMTCTHFMFGGNASLAPNYTCIMQGGSFNGYLYFRVPLTMATNNNELKTFLSAQYAAGTPVTVYYQLADETADDIDAENPATYYPETDIYTDGEIKPEISAEVKIIGL